MNEDNKYINIKDVAEAKGLTSTRSIRLELNKIESKYISREIKVIRLLRRSQHQNEYFLLLSQFFL